MTAFLAQILAKLNTLVQTYLDPIKEKVEELVNTDLTAVQEDLASIETKIDTIDTVDLAQLQSDTTTLKGDTTTLKEDTASIKATATSISADVGTRLGAIKFIQREVTTFSSTVSTLDVTLAATVNVDKSMLTLLGVRCNIVADSLVTLTLKNTTTITLTRSTQSATAYVSWQIVEFN